MSVTVYKAHLTSLRLLLASLLFIAQSLWAAGLINEMTFQHFLTNDSPIQAQYSIGGTNAIVQDATGFMWIAGDHGLVRYDSNGFKFYFFDPDNPKSTSSNYYKALMVDRGGNLWCVAYNGLNLYDPKTDSFTRYLHIEGDETSLSGREVHAVALGKDNEIYVATEKGLSVFNPDRTGFKSYQHDDANPKSLSHDFVYTVFVDHQNVLWVGTKTGMDKFDPLTGEFDHWTVPIKKNAAEILPAVTKIAEDQFGFLWIANGTNGVFRLDPNDKSVEHFHTNTENPGALQGNIVLDMLLDSKKQFWLAVDHAGIARFNPDTKTFTHMRHKDSNPQSISSDQVRTIYEDHLNNFWAGTFPNGINFYDHTKIHFKTLKYDQDDPNSLSHNGILNIFQDRDGIFWFGTEGGLTAYDQTTEKLTRYEHDPKNPKSLRANPVTAIVEASDGDLWVGAWSGGLHRFNKKNGVIKNYFPSKDIPNSLPSALVWNMVSDGENGLWISLVEGGGLAHYNPATDDFTAYYHDDNDEGSIQSNYINRIFTDSNHDLWIATGFGLDKFDKHTKKFIHFPIFNTKTKEKISAGVNALSESRNGNLYIGASDGLLRIMNKSGMILGMYDVKMGAPFFEIANILEDNNNNLWLSTTEGITRLNLNDGSVRAFKKTHGLAGENYNRNAAYKDKKGILYFGSTEGVTQFNPTDLDALLPPPNIAITDFRIFNNSVTIGGANSPLRQAINHTKELILNSTDNMFSFDFAALSFSSSANNQYAYMLEGFDSKWRYISNSNSATYTNLDSGTYTFKVKAANRDGIWNENGPQIAIKIRPPVWRSHTAYAIYALVLLIILAAVVLHMRLRMKSMVYHELSMKDSLTGIYNRVGFKHFIEQNLSKPKPKMARHVSLCIFDIDHFKRINDGRGHDAGDRVLKQLADLISANIRQSDGFARWGGEEFVVISLSDEGLSSVNLAEKLRRVVEEAVFDTPENPLKVTISIGVANLLPQQPIDDLIKRADIALYNAKAAGRNRVIFAGDLNTEN